MMLTADQHQPNITVPKVDIAALRGQRDALVATVEDILCDPRRLPHRTGQGRDQQVKSLDGIISLLNTILDIAEDTPDD